MVDIRPIDLSAEGLERVRELLNAVFPGATHVDTAYLERLCHGNPVASTFGFGGFDEDGILVAHHLVIPVRARVNGVEETGIWPFQLATRPGFRGKGVFTRMSELAFQGGRERGCGFAVGITNAMSTPLDLSKWNFQAVRQLDVKLGIGLPPPRRPEPAEWELDFLRLWNPARLAWRLGIGEQGYRVAFRGDEGHVYARTGRFGIDVEIGCFPREQLPGDLPRRSGWQPLRLWMGIDDTRDWTRSLYFDVPRRFHPSPLQLVWFDLTGRNRSIDPERVRFEVVDFDAY